MTQQTVRTCEQAGSFGARPDWRRRPDGKAGRRLARDQAIAASGGGVRCSGTNSGGSVGENCTKLCAPAGAAALCESGAAGEQAR